MESSGSHEAERHGGICQRDTDRGRQCTGISRVFKEAAEYGLKEPELKVFGTSIRINLFRKPFKTKPFGVVHPLKNDAEHQRGVQNQCCNTPSYINENGIQNSCATKNVRKSTISGWFGGAEAPPFYIRSSDMRGERL